MAQTAIQKAAEAQLQENKAKMSIGTMLNGILDGEKMRGRFEELLGKRTPQFLSSLTTMITGDAKLQQAFRENSMSVITSALKAASYDLPIDPTLGFAYIVPFRNKKEGRYEATFIIGYKGMIQLCLRTGAYKIVPTAVDVRDGELISYNRLTGECEFRWVENEAEREKLPIVGYAAYFRLKNGAEKTLYLTVEQIKAHEQKNRKGQYMGSTWADDFNAMAMKTVIRRLCSKYALMSIDYQDTASEATMKLATALAEEDREDEFPVSFVDVDDKAEITVDASTGEVKDDGFQIPDEGDLPWDKEDK